VLHESATELPQPFVAIETPVEATTPSEAGRDQQAVLARTPFMLTRCSADLRYVFMNDAYAQMIGRRAEDCAGKPIVDIMGPKGFETILPHVRKVLQGETVEYETNVHYGDVGPRFVHVIYSPERDVAGNVVGWVASIVDISDRKRTEARLVADLKAMRTLRELGSMCLQPGPDLAACLKAILSGAIGLAAAEKGTLQLFEPHSNTLAIVAHEGFEPPFLRFFEHVGDGAHAAVCAAAMRSCKQVVVDDVMTSDIFTGQVSQTVLSDAGVRAVISTPVLSSQNNLLGMISVHYGRRYLPTPQVLDLLDVLARQAGDFLERKHAEQVERTLVRELEHRCNNLLAVVQSIAVMSLPDGQRLADGRAAFEGRLRALARASRRLLKSDRSWVNLNDVVRAEMEPFVNCVIEDGPGAMLGPQQAQNLFLALHELATNAAKYGAFSKADGRVHISWAIADADPSKVHVRWREADGPLVAQPRRTGFGTSLLKAAFADVKIDYRKDGLHCEFAIPIQH
jgi:PAS domain S-box-containing protein